MVERKNFLEVLIQIFNIGRCALFQFVKYRLHLSLIFGFLLYYNNLYYKSKINFPLLISFGLWHFALFLFDRVYDRKIDAISQPDEYIKEKDYKIAYGVVGLSLLGSLISFMVSCHSIFYWLLLTPITFLYPFKIYKDYRVKSFFLVKNLYSAFFIYTLPLLIQAFLLSEKLDLESINLMPLVSLFIFVLVGEIFWDIRDMSADKAHKVHTLPNTMGLKATKLLLVLLILLDAYINQNYFSLSAYLYMVLFTFVNENTGRLIFHLPPLIALFRFIFW